MWVSKQLGHANMQMLLKVYSKWIAVQIKSNERGKIDAIFEQTATKTPPNKVMALQLFELSGRGERIRTSDHLHPMQVRYQAALRPEVLDYISKQNT